MIIDIRVLSCFGVKSLFYISDKTRNSKTNTVVRKVEKMSRLKTKGNHFDEISLMEWEIVAWIQHPFHPSTPGRDNSPTAISPHQGRDK